MFIYMSSHIAIDECGKGTLKTHELCVIVRTASRHVAASFTMFNEFICVRCIL